MDQGTAKTECSDIDGTLATIRSADEQTFLTSYVFTDSEVKQGVWIGATRKPGSDTEFQWEVDGSELSYTNLCDNSPSPITVLAGTVSQCNPNFLHSI